MNTQPVTEVISQAADRMREYAKQLDQCALRLHETGEWTYVAEAMNAVTNMIGNLRLDLFVTRPIRELEREVQEWKDAALQ